MCEAVDDDNTIQGFDSIFFFSGEQVAKYTQILHNEIISLLYHTVLSDHNWSNSFKKRYSFTWAAFLSISGRHYISLVFINWLGP